jgi:uncharacterized protein (TIGR02145 family)
MRGLFLISICAVLTFVSCKSESIDENNEDLFTVPKDYAYIGEVYGLELVRPQTSDEYLGTIGEETIRCRYSNKNLVFMVPEMEEGESLVTIQLDDNTIDFNLDIRKVETIEDPKAYLDQLIVQNDLYIEAVNAVRLEQQLDSTSARFGKVQQDADLWAKVNMDSKNDIAAMSDEDKQKLANFLAANSEWIASLDEGLLSDYIKTKTSTKEECKALIKAGREEIKKGNFFASLRKSIQAFYCAIGTKKLSKLEGDLEKVIVIVQEFDGVSTIQNVVIRKINDAFQEIDDFSLNELIAEDIEDAEKSKKGEQLTFGNGEPTAIHLRMKFVNIHAMESNTASTLLNDFKKTTDYFLGAYPTFVSESKLPLVWRPTTEPKSVTRLNNSFLSIDKESISNKDIILVNTQYNGDDWEVVFGNDGDELEPEFTFDIVYNDGHVELRKTINGIIKKSCDNTVSYGSVTDARDGNRYKTVEIGTQTWFAENLRYVAIVGNFPASTVSPYKELYGRLYTGSVTRDRSSVNVCPTGWHVPSDDEWKLLEKQIGMSQEEADKEDVYRGSDINAGGLLKDCEIWDGTNIFGLSLVPSGWSYRGEDDKSGQDTRGYYWTSTETSASSIYPNRIYRQVGSGTGIKRDTDMGSASMAVRCVAD